MTAFLPKHTSGRGAAVVCFGLWGGIGLGVSLLALLGAPILTAIYVTLMWMGGTVLFGLAALLSTPVYLLKEHALPVYVVAAPEVDGFNFELRGVRYAKLPDGRIVGDFDDGKHTFKNWEKFVKAVP